MIFPNSFEHEFLPVPFTILTLCGTWYPDNWSLQNKRFYKYLTALVIALGILLFLEISINVILTNTTDDSFLENIFAMNVFAVAIYKKTYIVRHRGEILDIIKYCIDEKNWHRPQNIAETNILTEIKKETRKLSIVYGLFIGMALVLRSLHPILEAKKLIVLPLEAWYPYDVNISCTFWITYFHQISSGVILTCMHLTSDTMFVGLLIYMRYQLDVLKFRLRNFGRIISINGMETSRMQDKNFIQRSIAERAQEHQSIYWFGHCLENTFKPVLMSQMVTLIPNLIINVYFLSVYTDRLDVKYLMTICLALVPIMQICMFCWYSNEVTVGSSDIGDALYQSNWTELDKSTKRQFLTIITRSSQAILITAGVVIPMNVDSFIKIMKTSYSAFNLLQQTSVK